MDIFAPGAATTLVLLSFRVGGMMLIAPMFTSQVIPMMVKAGLLVTLTWLMHPVAMAHAGAVELTPETALAEAVIGFAIGFGAAILVGAAEAMGDLLAVNTGLSGAAALDPLTNHSVPVLGQFANLFAVALLLSVNAHLVMLEAIGATLRMLPVGGTIHMQAGVGAMIATASNLFYYGLRFAAPVIAVIMLANVAMAVLGRVAPQLNILAVAFPVQIGLGLFAFAATIPLIATFFIGWTGPYGAMVDRVLSAFSGGGG